MDSTKTAAFSSRIDAFDLARGLAILFMMMIHVLDFYGQSSVRDSLFGHIVTFLGSPPAAPVFMFIMGIFIVLSSRLDLATGLKRAAWLFLMGYVLNLFRGSIPMWLSLQMGLVTDEQLGGLSPLTELLIVDILQFAGLAFALCVLLKHVLPQPGYWILAALAVIGVSPWLWDISTDSAIINEVLKLLWGHKDHGAMFPLFPWLAYPLLGMAFGYKVKHIQAGEKVFARAGLLGLILMLVGTALTLTNIEFHFGYYLRSGPGVTIWVVGFVLTWLWFCQWLVNKVSANPAFSLLFFWSRNVTTIYVMQWLIIGWGLMAVGVQQLSFGQTLLAMAGVMFFSDLGLRGWLWLRRGYQQKAANANVNNVT